MLASSFSTRFLLRKNRRSRLPAPLGPLFCRPRHGSAAPGPQRQNPGPPRFQLGFCCAKIGAAGYRPHLLGLPRKSGRGISLRETTLCGCPLRGHGFATPHRYFAVPVTAPPRRAPNGKTPALAPIRSHFACGETALAGHRPHRGRCFAVPVTAAPRRVPNGKTPALAPIRSHFAARNRAGRSSAPPGPMFCRPRHGCAAPGPQRQKPRRLLPFGRISPAAKPRGRSLPPPGATCSLPHFRSAQMWPRIFPRGLPGYVPLFHGWPRARTPALAPVRSHFAPRNRAGRSSAPPGPMFCRPRHGSAAPGPQRQNPGACSRSVAFRSAKPRGRSSAPPGPMFCRPRHGSAAPGPQRQNPGACSRSVAFRLRRNRAAGRCPRWGQRARYPIFAPLKCGPALAPRRLLPFGRISLRETAQPVIGPTGADVLACPAFALLKRGPPAKTPALLVFNPVFAAQKPAGASPRFRTAGR